MTPFGHPLRPRWLLEEGMDFLNHGSFGATPREVLAAQSAWRERLERQPVRFMIDELPGELRAVADELGEFIGAEGVDLVFQDNATTAVNAVLQSRDWQRGDEILLCPHAYLAVRNAAACAARRHDLILRDFDIPLPHPGNDAILEAFGAALTPRTRLAIVDHVSSPLSLVYPLEEMVALCRERDIPVLVDGAHAPGMLPLDLARLDADWVTGNCHKWLFAPKGCAFLWTAPRHQENTHPLVASLFSGKGYSAEFDWMGTRDPSAWLALHAALRFVRDLGPEALREYNNRLAAQAGELLAAAWGTPLYGTPETLAAMRTVAIPGRATATLDNAKRLHDALWQRERIEVPVFPVGERLCLRISAQAYNQIDDYRRLAAVIPALAAELE